MKTLILLITLAGISFAGTYDNNYRVIDQNNTKPDYDVLMHGDFDEIIRFKEISFKYGAMSNDDNHIDTIYNKIKEYTDKKQNILVSVIGYTNTKNEKDEVSDSENYANNIADILNKKGLDKKSIIIESRNTKDNLYTNESYTSTKLSNRVRVALYLLPQIDTDGDGVYDNYDECPETPEGLEVDEVGCLLDTDGDGVYDHLDKCPGTPKGFSVDNDGCPIRKNLMLNFATNSWEILESSNKIINEFVEFIKANPAYDIKIIGHTDNMGTEASNLILSQHRAEALKSIFEELGINTSKMTTDGLGESTPTASNKTKDGRYQNRRTVIELIYEK